MKTKTKLGILLIFSISFAVIAGIALNSNIIFANTPKIFTAVNISKTNNLDLIVDNVVKDTGTKDDPAIWVDPSKQRVSVMAYCSDAWLSDSTGKILPNESLAPLFTNASLLINVGDNDVAYQQVYKYLVYYTVQAVVRTGPKAVFNFPAVNHVLSPFAGIKTNGGCMKYNGLFYFPDTPGFPGGTLKDWFGTVYSPLPEYIPSSIYGVDVQALTFTEWNGGGSGRVTTTNPGKPTWQSNVMSTSFQAGNDHSAPAWSGYYPDTGDQRMPRITTSLVPVSFPGADGVYYDSRIDSSFISGTSGPATSNARVLDWMGAKTTQCAIVIHINGNKQSVLGYNQTFAVTLKNGSKANVYVNTTSAAVGFNGQDDLHNIERGVSATSPISGIVPNINPANKVPKFDLSKPYDNAAYAHNGNDMAQTQGAPVVQQLYLHGSIEAKHTAEYLTQDGAAMALPQPHASDDPYTHYTQIDISDVKNNCKLPSTLDIRDDLYMQPKIRVSDVVTHVHAERVGQQISRFNLWDGTPQNDFNEQWGPIKDYDWDITYPYGVVQDNMFVTRNYTFPVTVVSERQFQLFGSTGKPIPISTIIDDETNAFWYDPRKDNLNVTQKTIDLADPCYNPPNLLAPNTWFNGVYCWWNTNQMSIFAGIGIIAAIIGIGVFLKYRPKTMKMRIVK